MLGSYHATLEEEEEEEKGVVVVKVESKGKRK